MTREEAIPPSPPHLLDDTARIRQIRDLAERIAHVKPGLYHRVPEYIRRQAEEEIDRRRAGRA